jgi:ArsR family transcriptional regulator
MKKSILKILSNKTRLNIIKILSEREMCACEIPSKVKKSQPNVSQQLTMLERNGILKSRRDGKKILYSLANKDVLKLIKLIEKLEGGR